MILLRQMLHPKPPLRPSCREALKYDWFKLQLTKDKYEAIFKGLSEKEDNDSNSTANISNPQITFDTSNNGP